MLPSIPETRHLFIDGPAGKIEAILSEKKTPATACGIICHPDPEQEGTMHNKVVTALNWAMEAMGFVTVRFNYRGVLNSEGTHGHVSGELEDTRAVYEWLHKKYPHLPLHFAGFSFGAFIVAQLATELPTQSLVTVAPIVSRRSYSQLPKITCPWLTVVGEEDELISVQAIEQYKAVSEQNLELICFSDTTHFFHGKLIPLRETVKAFYLRLP
jgi:alpha/beta superfamily hydrolase